MKRSSLAQSMNLARATEAFEQSLQQPTTYRIPIHKRLIAMENPTTTTHAEINLLRAQSVAMAITLENLSINTRRTPKQKTGFYGEVVVHTIVNETFDLPPVRDREDSHVSDLMYHTHMGRTIVCVKSSIAQCKAMSSDPLIEFIRKRTAFGERIRLIRAKVNFADSPNEYIQWQTYIFEPTAGRIAVRNVPKRATKHQVSTELYQRMGTPNASPANIVNIALRPLPRANVRYTRNGEQISREDFWLRQLLRSATANDRHY